MQGGVLHRGRCGAPVELDEVAELEEALPVVWPWLSASAQAVIDRQGVVYTDEDGDLVTSIVNGKDCVFTCYDERGYCYCALEKALPRREEFVLQTVVLPSLSHPFEEDW